MRLDDIHAFYRKSDLVVLTSSCEGFPNVLLHAWSCGRPVVTSCDPDGVVVRYHLGFVARRDTDFENVFIELKSKVSASALKEMGQRGRLYVERFHTPTEIVKEICEALGI